MSHTNPRTPRFRFTIRTQAVVIALIALVFWWMAASAQARRDGEMMRSPQLVFPQIFVHRLFGQSVPFDRDGLIEAGDHDARLAHYYGALAALGGALLLSFWIIRRRRLARWFKWAAVLVLLTSVGLSVTWGIVYRNREYHRWLIHWMDYRIMRDIGWIENDKKGHDEKNWDIHDETPTLQQDRVRAEYHRKLASSPWYRLLAPPNHPIVRYWG